ncbi:MAG: hypothetical protein ACD_11C00006G0007 [uncultured bacterium]|nr:MAG: hypothetical protein ACD_11C00006G0007 [uncultured bacterium]HBR71695.1 hypothetical protein [Candidatus Moranbacteria bacterium]
MISNRSKKSCLDDFCKNKAENFSVLFFRGKRAESFYTEDSGRYITPREMELLGKGVKLNRKKKIWDSLESRVTRDYVKYTGPRSDSLMRSLRKRRNDLNNIAVEHSRMIVGQFSMARLWNLSIVGAILFGMFSMTMIYKYLGQGVSAGNVIADANVYANETKIERSAYDLSEEDYNSAEIDEADEYTRDIMEKLKSDEKDELEKDLREMVKGYPIEEMVPYIAEYDRTIAAFIVGIAKKESNWGKRIPTLNGQDCYNYWGYRGIRKLMGTGGHTCFNSRKDAVETIAKRINVLVNDKNLNTPEKMVIWKCGSNCEVTGGQAAADKWIRDVNMYFSKVNQ